MSRSNPTDLSPTNRNGIATTTSAGSAYLRGFNNASTATNPLMNDTT